MADLDIKRAERLLKSASDLYKEGDIAGVAGLAYQAFESALVALSMKMNGSNGGTHLARRERAKELLVKFQDKIDFLWSVRNVDFYGNIMRREDKREISREEVKEALNIVEQIIEEIKKTI